MPDDKWLAGRTALTTGAASGLGRATALALAEAGASVIVADIDTPGVAGTVEEITTNGGRGEGVVLDVTDETARRQVVAGAFAEHGDSFDTRQRGRDRPGYAHDIVPGDFERVMAVNCTGPAFLMSEFIKGVKDRPSDRMAEIVNIISLSAITVGSGAAAYNGSKAALAKVTECFQREILEFGWPCRIQGIMPAAMDTPMMERWGIPLERMMPPSDVASEVLHCLRRPPTA